MARAITESFDQMVLELETAPGSGSYAKICGLTDITVSRTANVDTAEVPDCDDESLPYSLEKEVRSVEITVSASGVWAQQSHGSLSDWFYSGATRNIRLQHANADVGDPEYESGAALLTALNNARTKGQKVTAEIEIVFDGTPTRADQT